MKQYYRYVALLRGINVGGNNIILMDDLRDLFEQTGFVGVKTYIQTGNVVFDSEEIDPRLLEDTIHACLKKRFSYHGVVYVFSFADMKRIVSRLPSYAQQPDWKTHVLFLDPSLDARRVAGACVLQKGIDAVSYTKGVVFWSLVRDKQKHSGFVGLPKDAVYKQMTIRNARTTRKIFDLMDT